MRQYANSKYMELSTITTNNQLPTFNEVHYLQSMAIQLLEGEDDERDYLLFTATFQLEDVFYKLAVAETINWEGSFTGRYDVLMVSRKGSENYRIYKDEDMWVSDNEWVPKELVFLIGDEIDHLSSTKKK